MDSQKQVEFIEGEIDEQLSAMRGRRRREKDKAFVLRMASVVLAGAITVLLGLSIRSEWASWASNIALVLGASITVLNAFDAYFDHRSLWVRGT
jgi:hypothetical protein